MACGLLWVLGPMALAQSGGAVGGQLLRGVAAEAGDTILRDLERRGHEIALHFHEDAHLGRGSERLDAATWAAVMAEEIEWIRRAGATGRIRYWSGGNLYPGVLDAASRAGLDVMSDHKNPRRQETDERLLAVQPWRPAGGPSEDDLEAFARHSQGGEVVYLPDGVFSRVDHAGMRRSQEKPFAVLEAWLREVVAPLVGERKVRWATFSEMADEYCRWERANPGVDPRAGGTATAVAPTAGTAPPAGQAGAMADGRPRITFAVNTHDWRCIDESADTVLRLIGVFQKHGARGDFYLTAPVVERYAEEESGTRPEQPFEFRDGLLVRPSDFSVTRFETPGNPRGVFWWNMVGTPREKEFDPVESLDGKASTRLRVVTSEDIVALAGQPAGASPPGRDEVAPMATDRPAAVRRPPGPRLVASGEGGAFVRIPSEAARPGGIAAMVYLPREGRYAEGVPVVIHVHGGVDAGGARGRAEYAGQGFAEIRFAFPGGGRGDERSGGNYDFRGPGCIRAVADVIRFAMGKIAAMDGRRIGEVAGKLTILTNNVGVVGSSHGGNAAVMAMALHGSEFPKLAWYASMESPFGEGAANVELGGRESGLNPAYDPRTGAIDLARLAWSEELAPMLRRGPAEAVAQQARGALFFDMDGDGRFREGMDFPVRCHFGDAGDGAKAWYSPRLLDEVERRHLLSGPHPDHLPTASQSRVFWRYRDAAPSIPDAVRHCPRLAVIVYANERDHVQADPAHTHIVTQVEGFRKAGARFVRLNPDRQYVQRLAPPLRQMTAFPDNPAGQPWSREGIVAGLEPAAFPVGLYMQAAVGELADRTRADEWSPDLRAVLVPDAPAPPGAARK
jgi:hypothetical protein